MRLKTLHPFLRRAAVMLVLAVMAMTAQTAWAQSEVTVDNLKYTIWTNVDEPYATVSTASTDISGAITIPATVNHRGTDYPVTYIEISGFEHCENITAVTICGNTNLGTYAFDGCTSLRTVTMLSTTPPTLDSDVFNNCDALAEIIVPVSAYQAYLQSWSAYAGFIKDANGNAYFGYCGYEYDNDGKNVTWTLTDSDNNGSYETLTISGTGAMSDDYRDDYDQAPWYSYRFPITHVVIGTGVTTIGQFAFYDCDALTDIDFGTGVTTIGDKAFDDCDDITAVTIPSNVLTIGYDAFENCDNLATVTMLSGTPPTIEYYTFGTSLTKIIVPSGFHTDYAAATKWSDYAAIIEDELGYGLYHDYCGNEDVTYTYDPGTYTLTISGQSSMYDYCQSGYVAPWSSFRSDITTVVIGGYVTYIGRDAFYGCSNLTSVTIQNSAIDIDEYAFEGCNALTSVEITGYPYLYLGYFPIIATVTATLTSNAAGGNYWMTFCNMGGGTNFQADASTTVYKGTVSGSSLVLTEVEDKIVTAGTAVILKSTSEHPVMTLTTSVSTNTDVNDLKGGSTVTAGYDAYTLAANGGVVGFYKFSGASLEPNKAHLEIPQSSLSREFLSIGGDDATGLTPIPSPTGEGSGAWYSLDGRKLQGEPTRKGVYIHNGKLRIKN